MYLIFSGDKAGIKCVTNSDLGSECDDGELRLVGGESEKEGRVEFCLNGFWETICDKTWTEEEALVACKQAGFQPIGIYLSKNYTGIQM